MAVPSSFSSSCGRRLLLSLLGLLLSGTLLLVRGDAPAAGRPQQQRLLLQQSGKGQ